MLDGGDPPPVVETSGLTKRFGTTVALDDVSVAVAAGQTHALVGRNGAGKSTLVALITGLYAPDSGEIRFHGESAPPLSRPERWRGLVACVYQRSTVIGSLSVAENLFLNPDHRFISWGAMRRRARAVLEPLGVDVDPATMASELSVEQRQFVEIARAVSRGARFVVLDEPTAQLDAEAITRLFRKIREMQAAGVTFLYISHHLQEIFDICQTVTVLARRPAHRHRPGVDDDHPRPGRRDDGCQLVPGVACRRVSCSPTTRSSRCWPSTGSAEPASSRRSRSRSNRTRSSGWPASAGAASCRWPRPWSDCAARRRARFAPAGGAVTGRGVFQALDRGVAFVPEDRHDEGLVSTMSVADNVTLAVLPTLGRNGWVSPRRRRDVATQAIDELDIKVATIDDSVTALSGGNQQKVVVRPGAGHATRRAGAHPADVRRRRALEGVAARRHRGRGGGAGRCAAGVGRARRPALVRSCRRDVPRAGGRHARTGAGPTPNWSPSMEGVADD